MSAICFHYRAKLWSPASRLAARLSLAAQLSAHVVVAVSNSVPVLCSGCRSIYGGVEEAPEDPTQPYCDLHPEHKLASDKTGQVLAFVTLCLGSEYYCN